MADDEIGRAVEVLRAGGIVAVPTETVYGLAADATNAAAVRRVFAAKGRPADHPLIVHLPSAGDLLRWAAHVPPAASRLAATCWPGPLTVLVPRADHVLDVVTGGRDTVGLRVPAHPVAAALLDRFGGGLAAPSANRFGRVSPTSAEDVRAELGTAVDLVLDGGECAVGVESTIVDCTTDPPQILRPGAITEEELRVVLGGEVRDGTGPSRAPGMLESHYAPRAGMVLASSGDGAAAAVARAQAQGRRAQVIDRTDDLGAYAHDLYRMLRAADDAGVEVIVAVLPPPEGLGHAIRDRLLKAAAPRAS